LTVDSRLQFDKYLPSLDGIRAVCTALVIGCHAADSTGFPKSLKPASQYLFNGHLGVTVFFVLSGFLITLLLVKEEHRCGQISLTSFYGRRFIRILPVYFTYLLVVFLLDLATDMEMSPQRYASAFTFTNNVFFGGWIEGHLWSLSVEEQYYLLWPLVLVFLPRRFRVNVAIAIIVLAPVFRIQFAMRDWDMLWKFSFLTNADSMMIGSLCTMALAEDRGQLITWLHKRPSLGRATCSPRST